MPKIGSEACKASENMHSNAVISRGFRFRLYPTAKQEARLLEVCGAARFVYNLAVEQRRDWWRQYRANTGHSISWASQSKELTALRAECDWLRGVSRAILEQALRDADRSFEAFFTRGGFPGFRSKDRYERFRCQGRDVRVRRLNKKWCAVKIETLPWLKLRTTRPIVGDVRNVTIARQGSTWFVSFACEFESATPANDNPPVGIDRGVARTITLSTGEHVSMPATVRSLARKGRLGRQLSRRKKGSVRSAKAKRQLARACAEIATARRHWLHEISTDIARRFGFVALEKLNTKGMTKSGRGKRGLNRAILDQGWSMFAAMLSYKLEERGGRLELVDPAYTSQQCSACGVIDKESRESQARFRCRHCDHAMNADHNAAINILRRSTAGVEGAGYGPVEARTTGARNRLENPAVCAAGGC